MSETLTDPGQEAMPRAKRVGAIAAAVVLTATMVACRPGQTEQTPPPAPVTSSVAASPSPSPEKPAVNRAPNHSLPAVTLTPGPWGPYAYMYAGGSQEVKATGARASFSQERPYVSGDGHSLMELSVQTVDQRQTVEVGWRVRPASGDTQPHLFVFHWVDGQEMCYNRCGFVQVSDTVHPDDPVEVGKAGNYGIAHQDGKWNIIYNGELVGYYPDELWDGRFTKGEFIEVFGEVASLPGEVCTDMGNGLTGDEPGAARINNFSLEGTTVQPNLTPLQTVPSYYSYGHSTPTSLQIGGPGAC